MRLKLLFLVISVCNFASFILHLHRFDFKRPKRTTSFPGCVCVCVSIYIYIYKYIYIYIKRGRVSAGFVWVDPPGQLLDGFYLDQDRSQAWVGRVDPPGRSRFRNYGKNIQPISMKNINDSLRIIKNLCTLLLALWSWG
jgi:hypothetical protein